MIDDSTARIAQLNDDLRQTFQGGQVCMTRGVQALGAERVQRAVTAVRTFSDFTEDNDPYGERDFGSFAIDGQSLFWKIDYYDTTMTKGSENPADPHRTTRVLTILLACEY